MRGRIDHSKTKIRTIAQPQICQERELTICCGISRIGTFSLLSGVSMCICGAEGAVCMTLSGAVRMSMPRV